MDVARFIYSTLWFELVDLCNRQDCIQVVNGVLEVYRLISLTSLLTCKVVLDKKEDRVA